MKLSIINLHAFFLAGIEGIWRAHVVQQEGKNILFLGPFYNPSRTFFYVKDCIDDCPKKPLLESKITTLADSQHLCKTALDPSHNIHFTHP